MKTTNLIAVLIACGLAGAGGYALYRAGVQQGMNRAAQNDAAMPASARTPEKKVLYWHDPMVPGQRFDKPGKSPFMDMQLVPVYAEDADGTDGTAASEGTITVDPRVQQNLGVRTAEVTRSLPGARVEAEGSVAFNERDQVVVQARATGYVEHLHVRATLDRVVKGQPLAELYVPDWLAAQEEFLSLRRMQPDKPGDLAGLVDGARQRMRLAGMNEEQVHLVQTSGVLQPRLTLRAPVDGVVAELSVREGMTVMPGASLFRINGLSTVWVNAEVPESQAAMLRAGSVVQARTPAFPGRIYKGSVQAILPEVNALTRTIRARIELANPATDANARLMPGMFVSVELTAPVRAALAVPTEAVIRTGRRALVMLADAQGKFRPVEVVTGAESGGFTEIKGGLQAGQKVVVSGQFLLDSEASLRAATTRMQDVPAMPGAMETKP